MMAVKKCPRCGKEFEQKNKFRKYCCVDCRRLSANSRILSKYHSLYKAIEKRCKTCGNIFTLDRKKTRQEYCNECGTYSDKKQYIVDYNKNYKKNNLEKFNENRKFVFLKYKYGMTREKYFEILNKQNGVCAICKLPPDNNKKLVVDHDHETGAIRGLLHLRCNSALGCFKDNATIVQRAADYLAIHVRGI